MLPWRVNASILVYLPINKSKHSITIYAKATYWIRIEFGKYGNLVSVSHSRQTSVFDQISTLKA